MRASRFLNDSKATSNLFICTQNVLSLVSCIENQKIFVFVISNVLKNIGISFHCRLNYRIITLSKAQRRSSPKQ